MSPAAWVFVCLVDDGCDARISSDSIVFFRAGEVLS